MGPSQTNPCNIDPCLSSADDVSGKVTLTVSSLATFTSNAEVDAAIKDAIALLIDMPATAITCGVGTPEPTSLMDTFLQTISETSDSASVVVWFKIVVPPTVTSNATAALMVNTLDKLDNVTLAGSITKQLASHNQTFTVSAGSVNATVHYTTPPPATPVTPDSTNSTNSTTATTASPVAASSATPGSTAVSSGTPTAVSSGAPSPDASSASSSPTPAASPSGARQSAQYMDGSFGFIGIVVAILITLSVSMQF